MSTHGVVKDIFRANGSAPVEYRRVYVWELPVRVYHWINAVALVLLCVTGYLIGAPIRAFYASEAYQQYWFGWIRFVHFPPMIVTSPGTSPYCCLSRAVSSRSSSRIRAAVSVPLMILAAIIPP